MRLYLGEIFIGDVNYDDDRHMYKVVPNAQSYVFDRLSCNEYETQTEAIQALKMQIPNECRAIVKEIYCLT